ncbi:oligosaccharyl transferase subunit OST3/OST6 family [Crassisporium funariophilum]|nr:oligosaccharyl transferase subunit OST3/OST6 family [Crassisporium funariophilum]
MKGILLAGLCAFLNLPFSFAATPHQQLIQLSAAGASNGIIKLDADTFDLLTSPKRTWSASIQLTALDARRKCNPCKEFNPSWNAVAKAWGKLPEGQRNQHFFATLDFDDGSTIFQRLGLASAPVVFNYPPAEGDRKPASGRLGPFKYDFSDGFAPGPLAEYLSQHTPTAIPYKDPIDWTRWITIGVGILGALLTLTFIAPIVQSRWTWAAGTVIVSLVMTSGFMFTRIRGVPYNGGDGNWIAAGYQNQFGQEVQVVSFIYGLLSFAFLMLIMIVPYQSSPQRQRMQVYLWTGVIMLVYSVLVSLFRVKNRGYPFKMFF